MNDYKGFGKPTENSNHAEHIRIKEWLKIQLELQDWYKERHRKVFTEILSKATLVDEIIKESEEYYETYETCNGTEHNFDSEGFGEWVEEQIVDFNHLKESDDQ